MRLMRSINSGFSAALGSRGTFAHATAVGEPGCSYAYGMTFSLIEVSSGRALSSVCDGAIPILRRDYSVKKLFLRHPATPATESSSAHAAQVGQQPNAAVPNRIHARCCERCRVGSGIATAGKSNKRFATANH